MIRTIVDKFCTYLSCHWTPTADQLETIEKLIVFSEEKGYPILTCYEDAFFEAVNQKLANNASVYQHILDVAFSNGLKLNYLVKSQMRALLDSGNSEKYEVFLKNNQLYTSEMMDAFKPLSKSETLIQLNEVLRNDKRYIDILNAIFSRFCFNLFEKECTATFFSGSSINADDYFDFISAVYPDMCRRDNALFFLDVSADLFNYGYHYGCNTLFYSVKDAFCKLNNHCDLVMYIPEIILQGNSIQWRLFSDLVLYAEKMNPEKIDRAYFRWKKIKSITEEYIAALDEKSNTEFSTAFQGFVFKDCFIMQQEGSYSLLLIFEKNVRDERPLYCPACRSLNIEGNSYPILNVRSWECRNPLCPDRSKYNRGKRYSFFSIMRQRLMSDEDNTIPEKSIASWHLDCVDGFDEIDAFEMVLRHYSCINDGVTVYSSQATQSEKHNIIGRYVSVRPYPECNDDLLLHFKTSPYFARYLQPDSRSMRNVESWQSGNSIIFNGDSLEVMRGFASDSIDGAVTSPPYYNAKEYSKWGNIYCYLYDMYNISSEVYRVLKPGSIYLYNIFDYFDNENNVSLSAMGNKRMILGAYMLDIFERIGFMIQGNIIWYKGEIQGNRSFNQGNMTPYYQAPLNCWEHVFILSKGQPNIEYQNIKSCVAAIRPVIKMVGGKNTLGHTAPFPMEIPDLLLQCMKPGETILDPFLGSGTTCIAANRRGVNSIGIERSAEYFELCKRLIIARSGLTFLPPQ